MQGGGDAAKLLDARAGNRTAQIVDDAVLLEHDGIEIEAALVFGCVRAQRSPVLAQPVQQVAQLVVSFVRIGERREPALVFLVPRTAFRLIAGLHEGRDAVRVVNERALLDEKRVLDGEQHPFGRRAGEPHEQAVVPQVGDGAGIALHVFGIR